jgi:hypothetical protein
MLEEQKWRDLCQQAMAENDVNRLLQIYLELDRATERQQRRSKPSAKPLQNTVSNSESGNDNVA